MPTALEEKWKKEGEEKAAKEPTLDDVFKDDGSLDESALEGSVRDKLPRPTGWRILILPYRGATKTKGGIALADQTMEKTQMSTVCGYVLAVGELAYGDMDKFPNGAWCEPGDWVIFARYAGSRLNIDGGELRLMNDDEVLARIEDPSTILHM